MGNQQQERIRQATPDKLNKEVDEKTLENIRRYAHLSPSDRDQRLEELVKEWDMERTLMLNASALSLTGLALGALVDKRWFILPSGGGFISAAARVAGLVPSFAAFPGAEVSVQDRN